MWWLKPVNTYVCILHSIPLFLPCGRHLEWEHVVSMSMLHPRPLRALLTKQKTHATRTWHCKARSRVDSTMPCTPGATWLHNNSEFQVFKEIINGKKRRKTEVNKNITNVSWPSERDVIDTLRNEVKPINNRLRETTKYKYIQPEAQLKHLLDTDWNQYQ